MRHVPLTVYCVSSLGGGAEDMMPAITMRFFQSVASQREEAWREKHGDGPVPADAKNRDVVWRALERKLAKLQQGVG